MKKRFLSFILSIVMVLSLFSMYTFAEEEQKSDNLSVEDSGMLGYGYDVTSGMELNRMNLAGFPILNMQDKSWLEKVFVDDDINSTKTSNIVEYSAFKIGESISQQHQAGINAKIWVVNVDVSTKFNMSNSVENAQSEKFEYYYYEMIRRKIVMQMTVSDLRNHLDPTFEAELKSVNDKDDAKTVISKYGSHLITGYLLGGRLEATNYKSSQEKNISNESGLDLSAKMGVAIGAVSAGASYSFTQAYASQENTKTQSSTYQCSTIGGRGVASMTLDHLFTKHDGMLDGSGNYEYSRWINALNNEENLEILGISNGGQAIEIWDLLPMEPEYNNARRYLSEAYMELCGDRYEDYCEKYDRYDEVDISNANMVSKVNGFYQNTMIDSNNYIVNTNLVDFDGTMGECVPNAEIFIDYQIYDEGQYEWVIANGEEYAEIIDSKTGAFRTKKDTQGQTFTIELMKCDEKGEIIPNSTPKFSYSFQIEPMQYSGGKGTEKNPYIISTAEDLRKLAIKESHWGENIHFILANDIDFAGTTMERYIGNVQNSFQGIFDGNYCTISGLKISSYDGQTVGIFGQIGEKGAVKSLNIKNSSIVLKNEELRTSKMVYAGMISGASYGSFYNCNIENCVIEIEYVYDSKDQNNENPFSNNSGALCGAVFGGTVANCSGKNNVIKVTINSNNQKGVLTAFVGGLIGHTSRANKGESNEKKATVKECYVYWDESFSQNQNVLYSELSNNFLFSKPVHSQGGLVGCAEGTNISNCIVSAPKCTFAKNMYKNWQNGTFVGKDAGNNTVKNCVVEKNNHTQTNPANDCFGDGTIYLSDSLKIKENISYDNVYQVINSEDQWIKDETTKKAILGSQIFMSKELSIHNGQTIFGKGTALNFVGAEAYIKNGLYEKCDIKVFTVDKGKYNYNSGEGKYAVLIKACGFTTEYEIEVTSEEIEEKLIVTISENLYISGETLSTEDIEIVYKNKKGQTETINIRDVEIYGPEKIVEGINIYTFVYDGYKIKADIPVQGTKGFTNNSGNVNGDKKINEKDLILFLQYFHFGGATNEKLDFNDDNVVDIKDAIALKKVLDFYNDVLETNK